MVLARVEKPMLDLAEIFDAGHLVVCHLESVLAVVVVAVVVVVVVVVVTVAGAYFASE